MARQNPITHFFCEWVAHEGSGWPDPSPDDQSRSISVGLDKNRLPRKTSLILDERLSHG